MAACCNLQAIDEKENKFEAQLKICRKLSHIKNNCLTVLQKQYSCNKNKMKVKNYHITHDAKNLAVKFEKYKVK